MIVQIEEAYRNDMKTLIKCILKDIQGAILFSLTLFQEPIPTPHIMLNIKLKQLNNSGSSEIWTFLCLKNLHLRKL